MDTNAKKGIAALVLTVIAYGIYWGARQYTLVNKAGAKVKGVKPERITLKDTKIVLDVEVENPTSIAFSATAKFDAYLNGQYVTTATTEQPKIVPADSKAILPVTVQFSPLAVLKLSANAVKDWLVNYQSLKLKIVGKVHASTSFISANNIHIEQQYELKDLLNKIQG